MPGHGRDDRPVAPLVVARDPPRQARVEGNGSGDGLGRDRERRTVPVRALPTLLLDGGDERGEPVVGLAPRVQPRGHPRRHGVGAVGEDLDPPEGGPLAREPRLLVRGQGRHGVGEHRVAAVLHPRGAGVVGLPGEVEAVAPVRPDLASDADGGATVDQVPALLDMQLDEALDPVVESPRLVPVAGRQASRAEGVGQEDAVPVPQLPRRRPVHRPGGEPRAQAGQAEPRPLLLREDAHPDRLVRHEAALAEHVDRRQPRHDTERPVVRPAVQHRVEVRPGEHALPR